MFSQNKSTIIEVLLTVFVVALLSIFVGYALIQGTSVTSFLIVAIIFLIISIIVINKIGLVKFLISGAIFGFVLGWRGLEIFPRIRIWPSEVFIWLGFIFSLLDKKNLPPLNKRKDLIFFSLIIGLSATIALLVGLTKTRSVYSVISEYKAFISFLPLMGLISREIRTDTHLFRLLKWIAISGFIVALIGIVEYFFPEIFTGILGIDQDLAYIRYNYLGDLVTPINLSSFFVWGTPVVSVILVPMVPISAYFTALNKGIDKIIWSLVTLSIVIGIIFSGYRSAWLGLLFALLGLFLVFSKRIWQFFLMIFFGIFFLPDGFFGRIMTIFQPTQGNDPTVITRLDSVKSVTSTFSVSNIFGFGWGSQTAFNDWLYLYVVLGLFGVFTFFSWYSFVILRIYKIKFSGSDLLALKKALIISLISYAVSMISGAMSQVPPIMFMFWMIFIISWYVPKIINNEYDLNK